MPLPSLRRDRRGYVCVETRQTCFFSTPRHGPSPSSHRQCLSLTIMTVFRVHTTVARIIRNRTWYSGKTKVTIIPSQSRFLLPIWFGVHVPNFIHLDHGMYPHLTSICVLYRVLGASPRRSRPSNYNCFGKSRGYLMIDQGHPN